MAGRLHPNNTNDMFKVGDRVVITHDNGALPGGHIGFELFQELEGKVFELRAFRETEAGGYWWVKGSSLVFNCKVFQHESIILAEKMQNLLLDDLRKQARKEGVNPVGLRKGELIRALTGMVNKPIKVDDLKVEPVKEEIPDYVLRGRELRQESLPRAVANYTVVALDGKSFPPEYGNDRRKSSDVGAPCHASLGRRRLLAPWKYLILDVHGHYVSMEKDFQEVYKEWVMFWVNGHAIGKKAVIDKGWKDILDHGIVLDASKLTISEAATFAIGLREGSEFATRRLTMFKRLLDKKVSPIVAWLVSCNVNYNGAKNYWTGGHQVCTALNDVDGILRWAANGTMRFCEKEGKLSEPVNHANEKGSYKVSAAVSALETHNYSLTEEENRLNKESRPFTVVKVFDHFLNNNKMDSLIEYLEARLVAVKM